MNTVSITIIGIIIIIAGTISLICVTSCMLSSMISQEEEERQRYKEELCNQEEDSKE